MPCASRKGRVPAAIFLSWSIWPTSAAPLAVTWAGAPMGSMGQGRWAKADGPGPMGLKDPGLKALGLKDPGAQGGAQGRPQGGSERGAGEPRGAQENPSWSQVCPR